MIDPRISLGVQVPDSSKAINIFETALMNSTNRGLAQAQEQRAQELAPFKLQQAQQNVDINTQNLNQNRDTQRLQNLHVTGQRLKPLIESGNIQAAQQFMLDNISGLQSRIEAGEKNLDITESMETLAKLQAGDVQGVLGDINAVSGLVLGNQGMSVSQREFNSNVAAVKADPKLETVEGKAAAIKLGLEGKASSAAQIQIANDPDLTDAVANSEAKIAGAKSRAVEGEKLKQQRKHKPAISALVKLAEKEATERGDVLTALQRSEAALPGLIDAVGQLNELATIATSTLGGKIFDAAVKQTGFGSTKGATARAKFIAIVNNQVLPLLKETFGAAFTASEGESLKATMGSPDSSPAEKQVELEAFIEQKTRDIQTKKTQLSLSEDSLNQLTSASDDELFQ